MNVFDPVLLEMIEEMSQGLFRFVREMLNHPRIVKRPSINPTQQTNSNPTLS